MVSCNIGNPLKTGSSVSFQVKFDSKQLSDSESRLEFVTFVNSTSHEEEPQGPRRLTAEIVKKAEISLKG